MGFSRGRRFLAQVQRRRDVGQGPRFVDARGSGQQKLHAVQPPIGLIESLLHALVHVEDQDQDGQGHNQDGGNGQESHDYFGHAMVSFTSTCDGRRLARRGATAAPNQSATAAWNPAPESLGHDAPGPRWAKDPAQAGRTGSAGRGQCQPRAMPTTCEDGRAQCRTRTMTIPTACPIVGASSSRECDAGDQERRISRVGGSVGGLCRGVRFGRCPDRCLAPPSLTPGATVGASHPVTRDQAAWRKPSGDSSGHRTKRHGASHPVPHGALLRADYLGDSNPMARFCRRHHVNPTGFNAYQHAGNELQTA
jgi:hypothetical protein